jgi:hypothetical protein
LQLLINPVVLGTFLVNNYKQAVEIIEGKEALKFAMDAAGISGGEEFVSRRAEEEAYLRGLSKEPAAETQAMEYYQRLVNLNARRCETCLFVPHIIDAFHHFHLAPSTTSTPSRTTFDKAFAEDSTSNGTVKRHARENYDKAVVAVQEMELALGVAETWTSESQEWKDAASLVVSRRYRLAVNKLEELVVKRLFELTKMNMSQTGERSSSRI